MCRFNTYRKRYEGSNFIYLSRKKGDTHGPNGETNRITASQTRNRVRGQDYSIERVQCNTESNFHRMIEPRFDRPRLLRVRTQAPLHCPPEKTGTGESRLMDIWDRNRSMGSVASEGYKDTTPGQEPRRAITKRTPGRQIEKRYRAEAGRPDNFQNRPSPNRRGGNQHTRRTGSIDALEHAIVIPSL